MDLKFDWVSIRAAYVEGIDVDGRRVFPTQKDLAASRGVSRETLCRHARAERWDDARHEFLNRVSQVRANLSAEVLGKASVDLDANVQTAATLLVDQVLQHIAEGIKTGNRLAPGVVKTLASALVSAQQAGRLAKGSATTISESTVNATVAEEREQTDAVLRRLTDAELEAAEVLHHGLDRAERELAAERGSTPIAH